MTNNNTTQPETEHTTTEQKITALAAHLDIAADEIEQSDYDDLEFEADGETYIVCSDDEADERAADSIRNDLWAFNASFILPHTILSSGMEDVITAIVNAKYEDATPILEAMIPDMDSLIEDAISSDGRGHFLNFYDGGEYESQGFYIYQR